MGAHPYVALFEIKTLVLMRYKYPQTNIELPLTDQEWSLNILLDDEDIGLDVADWLHLDLLIFSTGCLVTRYHIVVLILRLAARWVYF